MQTEQDYNIRGFRVTIVEKREYEAIGFSRFLRLDGVSIASFIRELTDNGNMKKLAGVSPEPQQVWVCLAGNEGRRDADCRCTVCVELSSECDISRLKSEELYSFRVPASDWAIFEVGANQTTKELHKNDVYKMVGEIGYRFNRKVGFHFDNEHEWMPGKIMRFLLPVIPVEE